MRVLCTLSLLLVVQSVSAYYVTFHCSVTLGYHRISCNSWFCYCPRDSESLNTGHSHTT